MINYFINQQFSNNIISYDLMTYLTNLLGLITGIIFVFLFTPFFIYSKTASMKRCKFLYPEETPIYCIKSGIISSIIVTSLVGTFLGSFILPFFIFNNLTSIRQVTSTTLWIYLIAFVIGLYGVFFRFNITYILTDKSIRLICPYKILRCMFKETFFIKYETIKSIKLCKSLFMPELLIALKDNKTFHRLIGFKNLNKAKIVVENYIK